MNGARGTYGGEERSIKRLVGNSEGKRPLGNPRRRGKDNTKIGVK
jgi:hypothetical protein